MSGLFCALTCLSICVVQIPVPATGGFVNSGDCFVIASGLLLPAGGGILSAGMGSALADVITGHAVWAPGTFVIKALMAAAAHFIYKKSAKKVPAKIIAAAVCGLIMCGGYLLYEAFILGFGAGALGSLAFNAVQAAAGGVLSVIMVTALEKTKIFDKVV